ncbi:MAG: periplasmic heavy metal sensor [Acidobacteria bacterium]|nr:periplasmic heavy metal sensor [Acidobacteriota bacterium]
MKLKALLVIGLMVLAATIARAQGPDLAENLFAPELIMQYQQAIGLTEEQKNYFKTEARKTQTQLTELQWKLEDAVEKFATLLKADRIDEQATTAQLESVLNLEREVKRTQLAFLIRLKNILSPEQQARLRELRSKASAK